MIGNLIQGFFNIFRFHKFKIFVVLVSSLVFAFMMFPYDDLSEVVSTMVSERTNNQVSVQFDKLGVQVFPLPALEIENVVVESSFLPPLSASSASLAPSISGLLSWRPGFNASIREVFNGDVDVVLKTGKKTEAGVTTQNLYLEIDTIDLAKANEALDLPVKLQGRLSGETKVNLDPSFANQPEGDVTIDVKDLRFPAATIPTQMGPTPIPGLSWANIKLVGKLSNGKLQIDRAELGAPSDLLNGLVKGEVEMKIEPRGAGGAGVVWGPYQLVVDLNVSSKVERDLNLFLMLMSSYKSATTTGAKYRFRVSGQRFGAPPAFSPATGI